MTSSGIVCTYHQFAWSADLWAWVSLQVTEFADKGLGLGVGEMSKTCRWTHAEGRDVRALTLEILQGTQWRYPANS